MPRRHVGLGHRHLDVTHPAEHPSERPEDANGPPTAPEDSETNTPVRLRSADTEEDEEPDPDDPLVKSLGIAASTIVIFRHKKNVFPEEQDDDDVLLTSRLLEQVPGDAVLHLAYETAKRVRRAGRTRLSDDTELWTTHRLALISQAYDRTTHSIDQPGHNVPASQRGEPRWTGRASRS
ncbi:SitI3 family protein [Streptomyces sp. NPDC059629]|uniref:SitI3 family protein n=1 Tax=Streptomyces sp. NPDC059629 TaxID=3346889 RepID=UPI0036A7DDE6